MTTTQQYLETTPYDNVQGDVLLGLPKRAESFVFFHISKPDKFLAILQSDLAPQIASSADVRQAQYDNAIYRKECGPDSLRPLVLINIGFSFSGLQKLYVDTKLFEDDGAFRAGQSVAAKNQKLFTGLADQVDSSGKLVQWKPEFLEENCPKIDFVLIVVGSEPKEVAAKVHELSHLLGSSVKAVYQANGKVRPKGFAGHEHFGYLDGVAHPRVRGFNTQAAGDVDVDGEDVLEPSNVLTDPANPQPTIRTNGSFLAFRELQQLVPEFKAFEAQETERIRATNPSLPDELIGARIVGRWESGVPVVVSPGKDVGETNEALTKDQAFDYSDDLGQEKCPYAAHIRKMNPRKGIGKAAFSVPPLVVKPHLIIRAGIPYGEEVDPKSEASKTVLERGLLFACYQAKVEDGFQFLQSTWANASIFPFDNPAGIKQPGHDLIIGQRACDDELPSDLVTVLTKKSGRFAQGIIPDHYKTNDANDLQFDQGDLDQSSHTVAPDLFVIPRGGEYFFMPSTDALTLLQPL